MTQASSNTSNIASIGKPRAATVVPVSAVNTASGKSVTLTTVRAAPQTMKVVPIAPAAPSGRTVSIGFLSY